MSNDNEYMRVYMLNRYHTRRAEAIDILGGECVHCGATESLEFDHVDRTLKTGEIAKLWSYRYTRFREELEKCQLLCSDCHLTKTKADIGVEHGGGLSGKYIRGDDGKRRSCPCELCRSKRRNYMKKYR